LSHVTVKVRRREIIAFCTRSIGLDNACFMVKFYHLNRKIGLGYEVEDCGQLHRRGVINFFGVNKGKNRLTEV
jgi:hypothetical protein